MPPNNLFPHIQLGGITGVPGSTGIAGIIQDDAYDSPKKEESETLITYYVGNHLHCQFGPALLHKDGSGEEWYIKNVKLSEEQIKTVKNILADIKLAPLYINDPVYKYTAKYILKMT